MICNRKALTEFDTLPQNQYCLAVSLPACKANKEKRTHIAVCDVVGRRI